MEGPPLGRRQAYVGFCGSLLMEESAQIEELGELICLLSCDRNSEHFAFLSRATVMFGCPGGGRRKFFPQHHFFFQNSEFQPSDSERAVMGSG